MSRLLHFTATVALAVGLSPVPSQAATALFSLEIGYNGVPAEAPYSDAAVLSFADDDALAVHELAGTVARQSVVLTLPDRPTQVRYPSSGEARPPSVAELRRALAELATNIRNAKRAGDEVMVWVFYSGHGWLDSRGRANLNLADGALSQDMLYDEVLPALSGGVVHLMIDACHAEALIRPRDVDAETAEISASELASSSLRSRLTHLPNVGVMMASASNTQAHEWDDYQTGVFTHELLSGLRGGADVNGDGRVEYSEIAAFLAAANRGVHDARAHLTTLVVAPRLYPRATIIDLHAARDIAHVKGIAHHLGHFQIENERGNRLVDLRAESGFLVDLVVPAGEPILLSNKDGEVKFLASADTPTSIENLSLKPVGLRSRGVVAEAMRRGLFSAEFGPSYYEGFMDGGDQPTVPVNRSLGIRVASGSNQYGGHPRVAWSTIAFGIASLTSAGIFGVLAARAYGDFGDTSLERESTDARDRYQRYGLATIGSAVAGVALVGFGYWLLHRNDSGEAKAP